MQDIVEDIRAFDSDLSFEEFFKIMKPRIVAMKNLPDDSVILENTSTSVFCVICPYKNTHELNKGI